MLFSIHIICIEIEDYITTVWNSEQNVESINTIYQNSVQSSTYQKWMSNTVKVLRRRMAPPCCGFSVFMGHITEGKLVFTLCVEPYYICTALVNGCYSVCCEKLPQVLELSIHFFFSLFFFYSSRFDRIYCHWPNCLKSIFFLAFTMLSFFYSIGGNIIFNTSRKMHLPLQYVSTQKSKLIKVIYK